MTIVLLTIHSCKKDEEETTTTPNNTTPVLNTARDSAVQDYNVNFVGSNISSTGWTGSTSGCIAGTCNTATDAAVIKRINY